MSCDAETITAPAGGASIGWFVGSGEAEAKTILNIPQQKFVRTAISLGYPDEEAHLARSRSVQARKPLEALVHQKRYS